MRTKRKNRARKKTIFMTEKIMVSKALKQGVINFSEYYSAKRLSKNLRNMLLESLMQEGATEIYYLQDLLFDMQGLFDLLEVIEAENKHTT